MTTFPRCVIAAFALELAACAAPGPVPIQTQTRTVEIKVPVPVPCFREEDRPAPPKPTPVDIENATVDQLAAAIAADDLADALYTAAVDRLFIQCQKVGGLQP
jgi:hypothetical protein